MADEHENTSQDRLAKIIFDGMVERMPEKMREKFVGKERAPWRRDDVMLAAQSAVPALIRDIDFAWVLTASEEKQE